MIVLTTRTRRNMIAQMKRRIRASARRRTSGKTAVEFPALMSQIQLVEPHAASLSRQEEIGPECAE